MKRIILAVIGTVLTLGVFAQKALIIHQVDGTQIEIPVEGIKGFDFTGKAMVKDNDYTRIVATTLNSGTSLSIDIAAIFTPQDPIIDDSSLRFGTDYGILYSNNPDVTIESGTVLQPLEGFDNLKEDTLYTSLSNMNDVENINFNTTYYFRSFIKRGAYNYGQYQLEEEYFYSQTVSINTGKPKMVYYGATIDPTLYAQTGYVMLSNSAWISLAERCPYITVNGTCADAIKEHWNTFLTVERIDSLKPLCTTTYECCDGMLYILDSIGDDFAQYAIDRYDDEFVTSGYTEDFSMSTTYVSFVECDALWNVPNNRYWEYKPYSSAANPSITIKLNKPLLANYNYTIEIMFAPDITQTDTLPSKFNLTFEYTNENGKLKSLRLGQDLLTNDQLGTVFTFDSLSVGSFGEASLGIKANVLRSNRDKYSRILRIAQIKVTPVGPYKQQEAVAVKEE